MRKQHEAGTHYRRQQIANRQDSATSQTRPETVYPISQGSGRVAAGGINHIVICVERHANRARAGGAGAGGGGTTEPLAESTACARNRPVQITPPRRETCGTPGASS